MKLELATVAALAATVSAIPLRVITLTGPIPHLAPADVVHNLPPPASGGHDRHDDNMMRIMPHPPHPCPGKIKGMGMGGSPFADLFHRLGLTRSGPHHHEIQYAKPIDSAVTHSHSNKEGEKGNMLVEGWKHHVEQMFEGGKEKIVPIMEGGEVRILPFLEGDEAATAPGPGPGHGRHPHGQHLRPHGGHHWRHKGSSFGSRLHRAMLHLSPPEAITLAFVLGAGIGSIMHLIFMVFLISIRRIRGGAGCRRSESREARRAARRERRDARKAAKAAKREGRLRLEGAEHEEVLPSYAEGETDRLVEKA